MDRLQLNYARLDPGNWTFSTSFNIIFLQSVVIFILLIGLVLGEGGESKPVKRVDPNEGKKRITTVL